MRPSGRSPAMAMAVRTFARALESSCSVISVQTRSSSDCTMASTFATSSGLHAT